MVPQAVYDSVAYRTASVRAKVLLFGFMRRLNGFNNGKLTYSAREMCDDLGAHYSRVQEALEELIAGGFVVLTKSHPKVSRLANEWRLTFAAYGLHENPIPATNEYKDVSPKSIKAVRRHHAEKRKRFQKGKQTRVDTVSTVRAVSVDTVSTEGKHSVDTVSTVDNGKVPKTSSSSVDTVATHISNHDGGHSSLPATITKAAEHFPDASPYMDVTELRDFTLAYLSWAGTGSQTNLGKAAKIPGGTLSKFLGGRGMSTDKLAALHLAAHRAWPVKDRKGYWPPASLTLVAMDGRHIG
tara:strand:+ start:31212 stop:32102 length:891 start_codon:yes stop_codon:yes gene_type:complete